MSSALHISGRTVLCQIQPIIAKLYVLQKQENVKFYFVEYVRTNLIRFYKITKKKKKKKKKKNFGLYFIELGLNKNKTLNKIIKFSFFFICLEFHQIYVNVSMECLMLVWRELRLQGLLAVLAVLFDTLGNVSKQQGV